MTYLDWLVKNCLGFRQQAEVDYRERLRWRRRYINDGTLSMNKADCGHPVSKFRLYANGRFECTVCRRLTTIAADGATAQVSEAGSTGCPAPEPVR
jgi:hypothetical protein